MSTPGDQTGGDYAERDRRDEELLGRLSAVMDEADPPPAGLDDIAMRALTWDVELGRLAHAVHDEPVLVRDAQSDHVHGVAQGDVSVVATEESFEVDDYTIDLTVEAGQAGFVLLRGIVTPRVDQVFLTGPGFGPNPIDCDEYGRFEADVERSTAAIEFVGSDDLARRTPLLDL